MFELIKRDDLKVSLNYRTTDRTKDRSNRSGNNKTLFIAFWIQIWAGVVGDVNHSRSALICKVDFQF